MRNNREYGFYWVKFKGDFVVGEWSWCCCRWYIPGVELLVHDCDLDEIDERRIVMEE